MPLRIVIDARRIRDFGVGTYIRNLVHALTELDHENQYVLVTLSADEPELAGLPPNFRTAVCARPDTHWANQITFYFFLRQLRADLVHLPLNQVPLLMPRPYVVTIHDMSSLLFGDSTQVRTSFRLYLFRRGLLRADRVIAVSNATRRDVENVLAIPPSRIRQIYDAPDPHFVRESAGPGAPAATSSEERQRTLERYGINYPFVLYAGAVRAQKNIPRLVEAFAVLRGDLDEHPEYRDLRLIIIGDEISKFPALRRAVIKTRVEKYVRFLGFVPFDTLRVFFEAASAFVFPSLYEGFGLPPLEAMALGTPVVTSNVSSLPEVVGDAAMLVNPENVFDIARGIREVLLDEDLRTSMTQKGYEQVQRFSWATAARQVLEIYREIAETRNSPN
ncbi:MAG TPA: glycosyltransferase family 1 protein [Bryobacteraceae bacterium]|nr:glycosyltransferase family 1 protein [Bryobacteraceae bacterium]